MVFCGSLYVLFHLAIVLSVLFHVAIELSVLRFTASESSNFADCSMEPLSEMDSDIAGGFK